MAEIFTVFPLNIDKLALIGFLPKTQLAKVCLKFLKGHYYNICREKITLSETHVKREETG